MSSIVFLQLMNLSKFSFTNAFIWPVLSLTSFFRFCRPLIRSGNDEACHTKTLESKLLSRILSLMPLRKQTCKDRAMLMIQVRTFRVQDLTAEAYRMEGPQENLRIETLRERQRLQ